MKSITDILKLLTIIAVVSFTLPLFTGIFNAEYYFFYILLIVGLSGIVSYIAARCFIRLFGVEKQDREKADHPFLWSVLFILFTAGIYQADKFINWSSECATYRIVEEKSYYQKTRHSRGRMIYYLRLENENGPEKYYCAKSEWDRYKRGASIELCRQRTLLGFFHLIKER